MLPRITVPHRVIKHVERLRARAGAAKRQQQQQSQHGSNVVIACKRTKFNHYNGQKYTDLTIRNLASAGWKNRKSKLDSFTMNATQANPAFDSAVDSFDGFGFHEQLVDGLRKLNFIKPTDVQARTMPLLMSGKNVLCAAETGSGKTLAFLLPLIDKVFRYRLAYGANLAPNRPHGIILTPNRELADQIYDVVRSVAEVVPLTADIKCGGRGTQRLLRHSPENVVDLLVSTPGVLSKLLTNKLYDLCRLSHIVFDEADTLLDDSFSPLSLRILQKLKVSSEGRATVSPDGSVVTHGLQVAFVGATVPRNVHNLLKDVVPMETIEVVKTGHLNRIMPHVPQKFVRVGPSQRPEMLLTVLKSNTERRIPTVVFCNKSSTACYLGFFLQSSNLTNIVLHANMPEVVRSGRFKQFQSGECDILICTDIASRGLDTVRARHVINYEFPPFLSDYIHRVGRVGRVGSEGACFALSYVCYPWDVELLWKIEAAARLNAELPDIDANIKRRLTRIIQAKHGQDSEMC